MSIYGNDFAKTFSDLLERSRTTCYKISQWSNLDQAYLSRLRTGERDNPSPETVVRICLALAHLSDKLNLDDFERLFNASGRSLSPSRR